MKNKLISMLLCSYLTLSTKLESQITFKDHLLPLASLSTTLYSAKNTHDLFQKIDFENFAELAQDIKLNSINTIVSFIATCYFAKLKFKDHILPFTTLALTLINAKKVYDCAKKIKEIKDCQQCTVCIDSDAVDNCVEEQKLSENKQAIKTSFLIAVSSACATYNLLK